MDSYKKREYRKKGLLSPRCAYLLSGPKRGEWGGEGLLEREGEEGGGGAYSKPCIFDKIHNNFSNFTITPITDN